MVASSAASVSLAFIAVVLRFLSRRVAKVKYEWDDWLALFGFVRAAHIHHSTYPCLPVRIL